MKIELHHGDCLEILRTLPAASVDAVVTDPPYGLSFMGKKWDYDVPSADIWRECLRVLKPGGHLLAFAGTRTQHRMAVRIEDAGFEIRDMIAWVYGSGFPKSLDVSKAIEAKITTGGSSMRQLRQRAMGADYEPHRLAGTGAFGAGRGGGFGADESRDRSKDKEITTPEAKQWQGWGTALKPAIEPITVARKPLIGTVAENVLSHGTGAINIDGCRVGDGVDRTSGGMSGVAASSVLEDGFHSERMERPTGGRWPANLIHDGGEEPTDLLGDAARFFYCAKASKADRDEGCGDIPEKASSSMPGRRNPDDANWDTGNDVTTRFVTVRRNTHPTVKPTALMRYLCRLVTPPKGIVLDPFMGSGSTGKAAVLEGFNFIGIEREAEYMNIAKARIEAAKEKLGLFIGNDNG